MGKFDLNTLHVEEKIFESAKKTLRIQKHPDTCERGLRAAFSLIFADKYRPFSCLGALCDSFSLIINDL